MKEEEFCLSWNDYSDHMKEMLQSLMTSQSFADVTLVCDDKIQLEAHKIVLISCSKFFEAILNPLTLMSDYKPFIYLKGINHQEMKSVLEFMYLGTARFSQERTSEFLRVATELELKSMCQNDNSMDHQSTEICTKEAINGTEMKKQTIEANLHRELVPLNRAEFQESENFQEIEFKSTTLDNNTAELELKSMEDLSKESHDQMKDQMLESNTELVPLNATECQESESFQEMEYKSTTLDNSCESTIPKKIGKLMENDKGSELEPKTNEEIKSEMEQTPPHFIHDDDIKYECQSCSQFFSDKLELNVHNKEYHQSTPSLRCWCGFEAESKPDIDIHRLKSHKLKSCTKCDFTADTYSKIFQHFREEHKSLLVRKTEHKAVKSGDDRAVVPCDWNWNSYFCNQCEFKSTSEKNMKKHSDNTHNTTYYKKHSCDQCDFFSNDKPALKKHIYSQHTGLKKPKKCYYCGFSTFDKSELKTHNIMNHQVKLSNDSEVKATHKLELQNHLATTTQSKLFQCEKCRYSTYKEALLDQHLQKNMLIRMWRTK